MLNSLYISNYRNLKELTIDSLDQINLITGKNNTGKSTLLEAIAIYASKGDFNTLFQLLKMRGEYYPLRDEGDKVKYNIDALTSLFTNRKFGFEDNKIQIGELTNSSLTVDSPKGVTLSFVRYVDEVSDNSTGGTITRRKIITGEPNDNDDYKIAFNVVSKDVNRLFPLEFLRNHFLGSQLSEKGLNCEFVRTGYIERENNEKLFDRIVLTDREPYVIEALKIIEPRVEQLAFVEKYSRERVAVVKLADSKDVLPLRSMGDGINRILSLILALVNCENGFLLIDEFENGLHHQIQEQLWKIIFRLAKALNVQVFCTTHSDDCISGFQAVLNTDINQIKGKLIRLDDVDGVIKPVSFSPEELKIVDEQSIEVR